MVKVLDLGNGMTAWVNPKNELAVQVKLVGGTGEICFLITPKHREKVLNLLQTEWKAGD